MSRKCQLALFYDSLVTLNTALQAPCSLIMSQVQWSQTYSSGSAIWSFDCGCQALITLWSLWSLGLDKWRIGSGQRRKGRGRENSNAKWYMLNEAKEFTHSALHKHCYDSEVSDDPGSPKQCLSSSRAYMKVFWVNETLWNKYLEEKCI